MTGELAQKHGTALITKIQKFCTHDGPGIRTTVFFKGCPLKCRWCHNPETQRGTWEFYFTSTLCIGCGACFSVCKAGCHRIQDGAHSVDREKCSRCGQCAAVCPAGAVESCGYEMTVDEIVSQVRQDACFYGNGGGLTLSGGEPMAQPEAALALLRAAKEAGLHTAIETCGYFDEAYIPQLAASVDVFLFDYKDTDDERHREYTGVTQRGILSNLQKLNDLGARIRLRCIMVAGVNMDECRVKGIIEQYRALKNCEGVELLPYHEYGNSKNDLLGKASKCHAEWIPSAKEMAAMRRELRRNGVKVL